VAAKERGAYMRRELMEGPDAVVRTLREAEEQVKAAADLIRGMEASGVAAGFIIGSGTSFHASLYLQYLLSRRTDLRVTAVPASEFAEWRPRGGRYFIIGFSQSGESSDIVEAFTVARASGVRTVAITNTPGSTLARISDACIITRAGEERAVAATKTFDAQLTAALMLAYALSGESLSGIQAAADAARGVLEGEGTLQGIAEEFARAEHAFCLGRGAGYPIALEAALKLKETSMVHAEGFASREFLHGPLQLVDRTTPVFVYATGVEGFRGSLRAAERVAQHGAPVVAVGPGARELEGYAARVVEVPDVGAEASAIPLAKAAQLVAYHLSVLRGLDPDSPSKLTKVVKY